MGGKAVRSNSLNFRFVLTLITIFLIVWTPVSFATDVSGDVWGEWTSAGNPYNVIGDLRVPPGSTLVIGPGCYIEFQGHYGIDGGQHAVFKAIGTETDSVIFTPADTITGWNGIYLLCADSGTQFSYCRIEYANPANYRGAIRSDTSFLEVNNCRFYKNKNYSVMGCSDNVHSEISNCEFDSNLPPSVVLAVFGGNPGALISNNTFKYSQGGPIIIADWADSLNLIGNIFYSNKGIALLNWGSIGTFFYRNIVYDNIDTAYGDYNCMILAQDTEIEIINNTFYGNITAGGMAVFSEDHHTYPAYITNNIFWGNNYGTGDIFQTWGIDIRVFYNDVQGGWPGSNINANPLFVDTAYADFHLLPGSPCIDAGDPASPYDPDSTRADMGALYFDQTTGIKLPPLLPREITLHQNYPNPFNAGTKISFSLSDRSNVTIKVFDMLGRKVCSLLDDYLQAGEYAVGWDGRSDSGERMSSGIYFYNLKTDRFEETKKIVILK